MNPCRLALAALGFVASLGLLAGVAGAAVLTVFTGGGAISGGGATGGLTPTAAAVARIPPAMLALYQQAATGCPGLPWTVLAAIGTVESDNGRSTRPGVHSGANPAGAEGPMQFEPATFAAYDTPVPAGGASPPSPYDPTDAVYAAAALLCANGAGSGTQVSQAIYAYNHSDSYVTEVLGLAATYGQTAPAGAAAPEGAAGADGAVGMVVVEWALAQLGTPYRWGGETPGVGFDCSGLAQAAYRAAGVAIPRVAQDQFDAGPPLPSGAPLEPGDLVFFGGGPTDVEHVGLYVGTQGGQSVMVDAPHTGADVRLDPFPTTVGGSFGDEAFVGATRPVK